MIAILLNDASFEQDIRELLMAFYPGETFTHKEEEAGEADLIVRGVRDGNSFSLDVTPVKKEAVHFALIYPDFSNRFETKNEIKQTLYRLLSAQTGRELPWGTLTGIRPTKIALTKLYDGWTDEQIETYMRETYFTSKEKIDLASTWRSARDACCPRSIMRMGIACMWESRSVRRPACTVRLRRFRL